MNAQPAVARMIQRQYTVRFLTPAFLGDAEQNARWRTPPFKAQLRQWWRVAYARERNFAVNVAEMRRAEGLLFGNAWLENDFRQSLVRLRLETWRAGSLKKKEWRPLAPVKHPEVKQSPTADLYLGYGPIVLKNGPLKANAAIQAGELNALLIAYPELATLLPAALWLMDRYGTVGGRSRNGWGSYVLRPTAGNKPLAGQVPLRPFRDCLSLDWPHAIGMDDKGALIWQTEALSDWKAVMKRLAELKIGLRTQFRFTTGRDAPSPEARHWLSYPVTNHSVKRWGNNARLPNTLRFKVREKADGKFTGVIFHMPHLPPDAFQPRRTEVEQVWRRVHAFLDFPVQKLDRIAE